ncbi:c-type cytochrome [Verticiella sediminum]|nr:c-type cytochrome [Verticiella sediminum]
MKPVLSRMLLASSLMIGVSFVVPSHAAEGVAKPDAKRGASLFEQGDAARGLVSCASCHGAAGDSSIEANPKLAGQPASYIQHQLRDLRPGPDGAPPVRVSPVMNPMAQPLSDQDIADLSLYIATQTVQNPATAGHEDLVELGQKIWRGGIASKNVPACAACHGADGAGIPGQYPYLGGQFSSYIQTQLEHFRSGERSSNQPMHDIALRLTDAEIRAVSDYAAGLR